MYAKRSSTRRTPHKARKDYASRTPSHTYRKGRVCGAEGCEQVLSVYNHNEYCFAHIEANLSSEILWERCRRCGDDLPLTPEFWHRDASYKSGFHSICKDCRNKEARAREQRALDKLTEEWAEKQREAEAARGSGKRVIMVFPNRPRGSREVETVLR
jgi:hypothetical protein